jgi:hypothetical protein
VGPGWVHISLCLRRTSAAAVSHMLHPAHPPARWSVHHALMTSERCTCCLCRLHVESVLVRTATGPGGISGPLRVDLDGRYSYNVMGVRLPPPAGPVDVRHTHVAPYARQGRRAVSSLQCQLPRRLLLRLCKPGSTSARERLCVPHPLLLLGDRSGAWKTPGSMAHTRLALRTC